MDKTSLARKVKTKYEHLPQPIRKDIEEVGKEVYEKARSSILERAIKHLSAYKDRKK